MPDEIIEELWRIKDGIAREQGNDVRKLAAYLQRAYPEDSSSTPPLPAAVVLDDGPGSPPFSAAKEVEDCTVEEQTSSDC